MTEELDKLAKFFSTVSFFGFFLPALTILAFKRSFGGEISLNASLTIICVCFIAVLLIALYVAYYKVDKRSQISKKERE